MAVKALFSNTLINACLILFLFIASKIPHRKDSICRAQRNGITGFTKNIDSSTNQAKNINKRHQLTFSVNSPLLDHVENK